MVVGEGVVVVDVVGGRSDSQQPCDDTTTTSKSEGVLKQDRVFHHHSLSRSPKEENLNEREDFELKEKPPVHIAGTHCTV